MLIWFYLNSFLTLLIGNMFAYAMIIYSRAVTGSDAVTGLVYAGNLVPPLVLGMYAGTVIDRFTRKRVVMIAQTTFIYTSAAMVFLTTQQFFVVGDIMLIAVMLVNGIGLSFIIPGRMALLGRPLRPRAHTAREHEGADHDHGRFRARPLRCGFFAQIFRLVHRVCDNWCIVCICDAAAFATQDAAQRDPWCKRIGLAQPQGRPADMCDANR
jgi:hypothetical protein